MRIWARSWLAAVATLLAVGCGAVASGTGTLGTAATAASRVSASAGRTSSPPAVAPALTVTPDTGLTGGEPLRVRLTGFPPDAGIEIYECVNLTVTCQGAWTMAGTGSTGDASVTFTAQASTTVGSGTAVTPCHSQCVLVAVAVKKTHGVFHKPQPTATAPLAFAASPTTNLADSSLLDTSWISATEGWALAVQPCAAGTCARVARTIDGGLHWQVLPAPPTVSEDGYGCPDLSCVGQVSFANPLVGYLWGPALLMTTDGGLTWHAQAAPLTETLTVGGGEVYRVVFGHSGCPGPCQPSVQQALVGSPHWHTLTGDITPPGRSGTAQVAASGRDVLLALYGSLAGPFPAHAVLYRSGDGGITWQQQADPCAGLGPGGLGQEDDLTGLAAAPGGFFAGLCIVRASTRSFVITSADAGTTWRPTAVPAPPPEQPFALITAASPATIAIATGPTGGAGSLTAQLDVTTDGGGHWATAATDPTNLTGLGVPAVVSFATPLAGQWIGDPHGIWTTTDGGLHWTRKPFR